MTRLFESGQLREFLAGLLAEVATRLDRTPEDEILSRSTEDLVEELAAVATLEPLEISDEPIDGDVVETIVDVSHDFMWSGSRARGFRVSAVYEFRGDPRLLSYQPSTFMMKRHEAKLGEGTLTVEAVRPGLDVSSDALRAALQPDINGIREMAAYASRDAVQHNALVAEHVRALVEQRKDRVRKRRDLAGSLGFPLARRNDAPAPVPMTRKSIGVARQRRNPAAPYRDEPALTEAQFEDAVGVVRSTLLAMERTPSVASGKDEEELRDQVLVQLNGTFEGAATGETFVQSGKTDILLRVEDRHVFVAECKWWSGAKACQEAMGQLLSYLPWRDEKAALILFIDRKDASAAIERADEAIRTHASFKRAGPGSDNPSARRNYVLGHPDDADREIHLAALSAVLPRA